VGCQGEELKDMTRLMKKGKMLPYGRENKPFIQATFLLIEQEGLLWISWILVLMQREEWF